MGHSSCLQCPNWCHYLSCPSVSGCTDLSPLRRPVLLVSLVWINFHGGCAIHSHIVFFILVEIYSWLGCFLLGRFINLIYEHCQLHWRFWVFLSFYWCLQQLQFESSDLHYPLVLIPESFKSLQVLILDLLSVFGLRDIDPFLVLQIISDVLTTNRPDMADDILPGRPDLICSPFLSIVEYILSQGTSQPLVIIF